MRIKQHDFEAQLKQVLRGKPKLSEGVETALFARAEKLLASRRERIALREADERKADQAWKRRWAALQRIGSRMFEFLAIHPDAPATVAVFAALVVAFLTLHTGHESSIQLSYSDLPALPKNNDAPARYDAQILAERQAYEREVQDAHQKTSGGI